MRNILPGLGLAIAVAAVGYAVSFVLPIGGGVLPALILGILIGNFRNLPAPFHAGIGFAERNVLSAAIVLMGFELQLDRIADLGWPPVLFLAVLVLVMLLVSLPLGKSLGFSRSFSALMGAGHAICGASAVAAMGPVVHARQEEVGVAVGIVNLMGTIGIFLAPPLVLALGYTSEAGGYLIGGVLNAVGQVVAAGFSVGRETGEIATLIKMQRILFLWPVLISASIKFHTTGAARRFPIPAFIIGFALASLAGSLIPQETVLLPVLQASSKYLLIIAMAGIGLRIRFRELAHKGPRALVFGGILLAIQLLLAVTLIPLLV